MRRGYRFWTIALTLAAAVACANAETLFEDDFAGSLEAAILTEPDRGDDYAGDPATDRGSFVRPLTVEAERT